MHGEDTTSVTLDGSHNVPNCVNCGHFCNHVQLYMYSRFLKHSFAKSESHKCNFKRVLTGFGFRQRAHFLPLYCHIVFPREIKEGSADIYKPDV